MLIVGLTGAIGMGKSTVADMLRRLRIPVDSADIAVHRLLLPKGQAYHPIAAAFPAAVKNDCIDRMALGQLVFDDSVKLDALERILHPLVAEERQRFLQKHSRKRTPIVVLDIPLLFEKSLEPAVDAIITVSAPDFVQKSRVLARPGMSEAKFAAIRARQWPEARRKRHSDFILRTGQSRGATLRQLQAMLKRLDSAKILKRKMHARNRPRY